MPLISEKQNHFGIISADKGIYEGNRQCLDDE